MNYKKLNPIWWLKNDDDPVPPRGYRPEDPEWKRKLFWAFRNPLHNLTFYVIGVADRTSEFTRKGTYPRNVFNQTDKRWNFCWIDGIFPTSAVVFFLSIALLVYFFNCQTMAYLFLFWAAVAIKLPFVSYINSTFKFYIGWRNRGNFGFKLTRNR